MLRALFSRRALVNHPLVGFDQDTIREVLFAKFEHSQNGKIVGSSFYSGQDRQIHFRQSACPSSWVATKSTLPTMNSTRARCLSCGTRSEARVACEKASLLVDLGLEGLPGFR